MSLFNQTNQDIINIQVTPKKGEKFFLRLDLAPGHDDKVANPLCDADLRVDSGLRFVYFDDVPLKKASALVFCDEHDACVIILDRKNGNSTHISGRVESLVPAPGSKPVCELGQFRPRMTMKDVCAILASDTPVDDNGSLLTGLGFGGMLWAARLTPAQTGKTNANSILEHLELRRKLSSQDVAHVLDLLLSQGYAPWQAEFPGMDMDFADMPKMDETARKRLLSEAIEKFLADSSGDAERKNAAYRQNDEARILMAPANILNSLANADSPDTDVQLFTIILQPRLKTLLVDVAAYEGDGQG